MANGFKRIIDRQMWVQVAPAPNVHAAGVSVSTDLRNDASRNPFVYQVAGTVTLNRYGATMKGWQFVANPAVAAVGAGATSVFAPSRALVGVIGAGSSTTSINTTTVMTAVGANSLASREDAATYGYRVRITGSAAGSSGRVEERWIVGNTAGTTPTLVLDTPLTFTPMVGDTYEILSGRLYMISSGVLAATTVRSFEVATGALASLANTNLPATIATDSSAVALDEQYVPHNRRPGEGFLVGAGTYDASNVKNCLTATATALSSITGQAAAGDNTVLANEYRNFQIRIVEDTTVPTAVGQRRIIASHTAGPSPVYTLGTAWAVTPSANARFVIEYPNQIVMWSSAVATTFTYNYTDYTINNGTTTMAPNTWSATYFGARGGIVGLGVTAFQAFGATLDAAKNLRHSHVFTFRGGAGTVLDILDIAGGTTGAWQNAVAYEGAGTLLTTGTCSQYAPATQNGRFAYLNIYTASAINQMFRFDILTRSLQAFTPTDWIQAGVAAAGNRVGTLTVIDGANKYTLVFLLSHLAAISQEIIVQT